MNLKAILCHVILFLVASLNLAAQEIQFPDIDTSEMAEGEKTLLILNSYNENSPWTRAMVTPITYYIANAEGVHAELINLNSVLITDSTTYDRVRKEFFNTYSKRKVDYVAFIGQMAFTFRDEIKDIWGDIPMLLITRDLTIASPEYYFSGFDNPADEEPHISLNDLKSDYNFTAIYVPDYYKETIDLMADVIKDMDELIFFSDAAYYNRYISRNIEIYLLEEYPGIKYKWIQASEHNDLDLQYYLVHSVPTAGLLMSSWFYEKKGALGYPALVMGDLNLLFSSVNPVFSLRHAYINLGAIGGAYSDPELIRTTIVEMVARIVSGEEPRDIRFYSNRDNYQVIVKYPRLKEYGFSEGSCPKGTVFIDKPLTFWQKYYWQVIVAALVLMLVVFMLWRRNVAQKQEIEVLRRHKMFIETMPVPYAKAKVKYDMSMRVVNIEYNMFNEAFDEIIKNNRVKGKPYILFPANFISEKTSEMLETNQPVCFTHYFPISDKYYTFTLCIIDRRKKDEREFADMIDIFAVDITQRQKDEKELRELTQRLDLTLSVANVIPWEWDMVNDMLYFGATDLFRRYDNTFINSDPSKKDWSGVPQAEIIGMMVKEDKEKFRNLREQLMLGNIDKFHIEYRLNVPRRGVECLEWIDSNGAVSERNSQGHPTKVIGSIVLTTDRKSQEMELKEASEKANESDNMKTAFLTNMSHEIRTPLNAILGFAGLMGSTEDPMKRKEYGRIISRNNKVLLNLINDVLDLAKIESNTVDIHETAIDLNLLMQTIGDSIRERLQKDVVLNIANGMPKCFVMADSNRISQVMMNLLGNSCRFTEKGSITFGYEIIGQDIHFFVKATGIGVEKKDQSSLFNRFVHLNNDSDSHGLGLSISKKLVECMGGVMGMESRGEGCGSIFWFDIPYKPIDRAVVEDLFSKSDDDNVELSGLDDVFGDDTDKHMDIANRRERPIILVAEDVDGNFLLLKNFIPDTYDVEHAWNGREAVELCNELKPDLILMDINMPGLDGYGAIEEIRKEGNKVPVVAVTAYAYASDRKRILSSGFNDFLAKPVSRESVLAVIKRYVG